MTIYPTEHVACNGCTACCKREAIILVPEDTDPLLIAACDEIPSPDPYSDAPTTRVLRHRPNGDCVFLGERGCMIYDQRPAMCRTFSCVKFVEKVLSRLSPSKLRRAMRAGEFDEEVWDAGVARLQRKEAS